MSHNAFWILPMTAVLLARGLAGHDQPSGVDHSVTTSSQLPVYRTPATWLTWLSDQHNAGTSYVTEPVMTTLNSDMTTLNSDMTTLNSDMTTLNSDMTTLNSDMTTLNSDMTTLNSDMTTLNSDMTTLNSDMTTLNSDMTTLNSDMTTLNSDMTTLNSDMTTLNSDMTTLNLDMTTLNSDMTTLNSDMTTLNSDMTTLNSDMLDAKHSLPVNTSPPNDNGETVDDQIPQTEGPKPCTETAPGEGPKPCTETAPGEGPKPCTETAPGEGPKPCTETAPGEGPKPCTETASGEGPKPCTETASGEGSTANGAQLTGSFLDVQRALDIQSVGHLTNALTPQPQGTYNCSQMRSSNTTQSEPMEMSEKRPQAQEVPETADCTSVEQIQLYSNTTLSNMTDQILIEQHQSYFLSEQHTARQLALSSHRNKATQESSNDVTQESSNDVTQESSNDVTEGSIKKATQESSNDATEGSMKKATEGSMKKATEGSIKKATEESSNDATEGSMKKATEGSMKKATEESSNDATEGSMKKATEESRKKTTQESTDNINVVMDIQRASGVHEDAQIRNDHIMPMNKNTYPPKDDQVVDNKIEPARTDQSNMAVPLPQFRLADMLIPWCPNGMSCRDYCDENMIPGYGGKDGFRARGIDPASFTNVSERDTSLMYLSDFAQAKVNVSSSRFSNACPKEKFPNPCNCDRKCIIYGDCCPDVFVVCWNLFSSEAVESFIQQTHKELVISRNHVNVIDELRQGTCNSQKVLHYLYANFGSCQVIDRVYNRRMMFVSRCPDMTAATLKHSCEQSESDQIPPVTATFGDVAIAFINRFCAQCHGVLQDEYTIWATSVMCDPSLSATYPRLVVFYDMETLIKLRVCNVTFRDTQVACQGRTCQQFEKLTSQQEQQLLLEVNGGECKQVDALLCRSYYFNADTHRNPHCQKCLQHGNRHDREVGPATPLANGELPCPTDSHRYISSPGGIFLILDVSGSQRKSGHPSNTQPDPVQCPDSEVFDLVSQTCKVLLCPVGHIPERGQCVPDPRFKPYLKSMRQPPETRLRVSVWTHSGNISCQLFMAAFLDTETPNLFLEAVDIHVYGLKNQLTETIQEFNNSRSPSTCVELDWKHPTHNDTLVAIKLAAAEETDLQTWQAVGQFAEHVFPDDYHMTMVSSQGYHQSGCAFGTELIQFRSFHIEEVNGILQARVNVEEHEVHYPLAMVAYRRYFVKVGHVVDNSSELMSVCEASKLLLKDGCWVVSYTLNNTSRNISQLKEQYGADNVDVQGHQVYVCLPQKSSFSATAGNITLLHILTWTMAGISILCLTIMLSLYCLFPELLTLPGKMMASLATTMLLSLVSNSLTLVKIRHRHVCPVVGAASHVLVLAQYGWMSAIAVNMALTFGPKTLKWAKSLNNKSFIKYNCLVWGTSLILVLAAFILDILHEDPAEDADSHNCTNITSAQAGDNNATTACSALLKANQFPRYGTPYCTWFSGPTWAQLAFMVIPFAISYVNNLVCYAITLFGIHRSGQQVQRFGQRTHQRLQCVIYIKLSTAMGFTSALSFVKTLANTSDALSYFLMSWILLQGVFLFLAFTANRRLLSLVKKRFSNKEKSLKSSTIFTVRGFSS